MRRILVIAVLVGGLIAATALPASAATYTGNQPITPGAFFQVVCPEGENFISGTTTFWRSSKMNGRPLGTGTITPHEFDSRLGNASPAPPRAEWVSYTYECQPGANTYVIDQTLLALEGGVSVTFSCPAGYSLDPASVTVTVVQGSGTITYTTTATSVTVTNETPPPSATDVHLTVTCMTTTPTP